MGKTAQGIKDIKQMNVWDFFDIMEYNSKKAKFDELTR
jgi:hypothetical protein